MAGVVSFFAPCVLPLLPTYIGYVLGVTGKEIERNGFGFYRSKVLISSFFYIIGFSLVFMILGTSAGGLGLLFRRNILLLERLGGIIIILMGLEFAGYLNIPVLNREKKLTLPKWTIKLGYIKPFLVGITFAFAWTPCIGVVLGSILALAAVSGTAVRGAYLLLIYSLGISLPFLIVSLTLAQAPQYLKPFKKHIGLITRISGIVLIVLGLLLLADWYKYINAIILGF